MLDLTYLHSEPGPSNQTDSNPNQNVKLTIIQTSQRLLRRGWNKMAAWNEHRNQVVKRAMLPDHIVQASRLVEEVQL